MKRILLILTMVIAVLQAPPVASGGSSSVDDFTYVSARARIDGNGSDGIVDVACPDGTRTTGVGGSISNGNGNNARFNKITGLDHVLNDPDTDQDDGARIEVWNVAQSSRMFTAYAVCSGGVDAGDQSYNTTLTNIDAGTSSHFGPVTCAGGAAEEVLGGGGGVDNNAYDLLSVKFPYDTGITIGIRGVNPNDRNLQKTAICMPVANRAITVAEKIIEVKPNEIRGRTVMCPRGTHVTSGGGYGGALFTLLQSKPVDGPDGDHVPDDGWTVRARNTYTEKSDFYVHAICAGPPL